MLLRRWFLCVKPATRSTRWNVIMAMAAAAVVVTDLRSLMETKWTVPHLPQLALTADFQDTGRETRSASNLALDWGAKMPSEVVANRSWSLSPWTRSVWFPLPCLLMNMLNLMKYMRTCLSMLPCPKPLHPLRWRMHLRGRHPSLSFRLKDATYLRNRMGFEMAFMGDPLLAGMLAARASEGISHRIRSVALMEAKEEAKKAKDAGKQQIAVRELVGPRGGLPTLRQDLLKQSALFHLDVSEKDTNATLWEQGLVNVPFWEYWTSPYSSHYRPYT